MSSVFAWYTAAFQTINEASASVGAVMNNSTFASIALTQQTIANDTHNLAAAGATVNLLPATSNNAEAQATSAFQIDALKTYIDTDAETGNEHFSPVLDHTAEAVGLKFTVTMAYNASASSSRKYKLEVTMKNGITINQWCLAYSSDDSSYTTYTDLAAGTAKQVETNIVQSTSTDTVWYFVLWVNGLNVSSAVAAESGLVTFTLTLL